MAKKLRRRTKPRKPTRTRTTSIETQAHRQAFRRAKSQTRFLREFVQCGNVLRSALAAKVGRRTVYEWLESDAAFKTLYAEAHEDALDALEEEARRRAVDGVDEPVYQQGRLIGWIRKYSDTLLVTLLKGKRPETYRDRHEHTGKNGAPLSFTLNLKGHDDADV